MLSCLDEVFDQGALIPLNEHIALDFDLHDGEQRKAFLRESFSFGLFEQAQAYLDWFDGQWKHQDTVCDAAQNTREKVVGVMAAIR